MKNNKHKMFKIVFNILITLTVGIGTIFIINSCDKNKSSHKKEPLIKSQTNPVNSTLNQPKAIILPEPKSGENIIIDGVKINAVIDEKMIYDQELPKQLYLLENGDIPKYTTNVKDAWGYVKYQPEILDEIINISGIQTPLPTAGQEFDKSLLTLGNPKIGSEYSHEMMPSVIDSNGKIVFISKLDDDIYPGANFNSHYINFKIIDTHTVEIEYAGINTGVQIVVSDTSNSYLIDNELNNIRNYPITPNWYSPGNPEHVGEYPIFYDGIDTGVIFPYFNDRDVAITMLKQSDDIPHYWYNIGQTEIQEFIPDPVVPNPVEHPNIIIVKNGVEQKVNAIISRYKYDQELPSTIYKIENQGEVPTYTTDVTKTTNYIAPVPAHSASILKKDGENILLPIEFAGKEFDPALITLGKPLVSSTYIPVSMPTIKGQEIVIKGFEFKPGEDIDYSIMTMSADPEDSKSLIVWYGGVDTGERYPVENNKDESQITAALIKRKQWPTEANTWYSKGIAEKSGVYEVFYNGIDTGATHQYNKSWEDATLEAQQDQNFPHDWLNIGKESFEGFIPEPTIPNANLQEHIIVFIDDKPVDYNKTLSFKWDYDFIVNGIEKPIYIKKGTENNPEYTTDVTKAVDYSPGQNSPTSNNINLIDVTLNIDEQQITIDE